MLTHYPGGNRMRLFVAAILFNFLAITAHAHKLHTPEVCTTGTNQVCAHLGYDNEPDTTKESEFMLHFMGKAMDPKLISNVTVKILMNMPGHTHGGPPVVVTATKTADHFTLTKVNFTMAGGWQIVVDFNYDKVANTLIIPIVVK